MHTHIHTTRTQLEHSKPAVLMLHSAVAKVRERVETTTFYSKNKEFNSRESPLDLVTEKKRTSGNFQVGKTSIFNLTGFL